MRTRSSHRTWNRIGLERRHWLDSFCSEYASATRTTQIEVLEQRTLLTASALGTEYQINTTVSNDQRAVAIGSNPNATQVVMAWVSASEDGSGDGVYAQRYDLNGNRVGAAFRVNGTTGGNQNAPAVGMDSLGNFVVVWQSSTGDGSGDGIYARRFGFDATPLAGEFRVNSTATGNQQAPAIAMTDLGGFAIAFHSASRDASGNAVVARVYNSAGTALANDFQVNQVTAGNQQNAAIAMDSMGRFIVTWQSAGQDGSGDAIVARRYSATGSALANEFVVNQTTAGNQNNPSIAANPDGSFIIAWQSAGQDGSGDAIVTRRYGPTGTALANEFVVNQFTSGNQSAPSVSTAGDSGFVIAWQSATQDGSGDAVVARQYSSAGAALTNELVVNTFPTGAQNAPATGIESDGDFLVAWQSPGQETGGGASLGVFARRFSAVNDAPVMPQISNQVVDLGGVISFTVQVRDQDLAIDLLTYSLGAGAPAGATIDPSTGAFTWDTSGIEPGRYFVTVIAQDLAGLTDSKEVAMTVFAPGERTALDDFVNQLDPAYTWDIRGRVIGEGFTKYNILLTSGTWRTAAEVDKPLWQHWMAVYVPTVITQDQAVLFIDGGSNSSNPPASSEIETYAGPLAAATGAVLIDLFSIPSQPLRFAGETATRVEDSIIAYSWRKYLETGDPTWPVNLPMTRAVMRAMDAVMDFVGSPTGGNFDISSFIVSGGSKRGWTTWLTSATDPRVSQAAPLVSDLLNMEESFVHHYAYYDGNFSPAVKDYVNEGILNVNNFGLESVDSLLAIVDPYTYRDRLTLPKFIINASGDEFFVPDSWKFYYDELIGPKAIRYLPNSGHGVSDVNYIIDGLVVLMGMLAKVPLPEYDFHQLPDGTIELTTSGTVTNARLWKADNATARDFRWPVVEDAFIPSPLTDQGGGVYRANVATPQQGWTAYFIEVSIQNALGHSITVTSGIYLKGPPTNVQPKLEPVNDIVIDEGSPLSVALSASDPDPGQTLTYSLEPGAPSQVSINPISGVMSGVWNDQVAGALPIVATVKDNGTPNLPNRRTFRVTVVNVAPTAEITGPSSGSPGQSLAFTLTATDPSSVDQAAGFTYKIDWDGDGIVDQTVIGPSGTVVNHTYASAGNFVIRVTATDKDNGVSTESTLSINLNRPPVDPHNQQPLNIFEGDNLALSAPGWTDPDDDPLTYRWDLNGDGDFGDALGANPIVTWSDLLALGIVDGPGTYDVRLMVSDDDGGVTITDPVTLSVVNVAPIVAVNGPTSALRGEAKTFTLTATDTSAADEAAGFIYTIDWGDGSPTQQVIGGATVPVTHGFNAAGLITVTVTATDQDGDTGVASTHEISVDAVQLRPNVENPTLIDLVWGGTGGRDQVAFEQVGQSTTVRVSEQLLFGSAVNNTLELSGITGRVIGYGHAGNDTLRASDLSTVQATLNGGAGNNTLYGGQAGDILIGGSNGGEGQQGNNVIIAGNGNNTIYGNGVTGAEGATGGNNLIVGSTGNDTIYGSFGSVIKKDGSGLSNGAEGGQNLIIGGGGSDTIYASHVTDGGEGGHGSVLVAGATNLNQAALTSVFSEWTSTRDYATRVDNILGIGTGPRNNTSFLQSGVTVFDDDQVDSLFGDTKGELNWFLYTLDEDSAHRTKLDEILTGTPG